MAHYDATYARFRGRLVCVSFRYGCYNGAYVVKGKAMCFSPSDRNRLVRKLLKIASRQQSRDAEEWQRTHPDEEEGYW